MDDPTSVVFIDATTYLVCNYNAGNVVMEDVNGTTIRVVAEIGGAKGLLLVPDSRQLGVANYDNTDHDTTIVSDSSFFFF